MRPCDYCRANYGEHADAEMCEFAHRDTPAIYDLAHAMARVFQHTRTPTAEQVAWFLEDAEAVIDDFEPMPDRWRVRRLPDSGDEFLCRFRINDVTYVIQDGEGHVVAERLSTYRSHRAVPTP